MENPMEDDLWEDHDWGGEDITRDSSLLLNMRGCKRLAGNRDICRRITEEAWER
jgi:hypothetical protein